MPHENLLGVMYDFTFRDQNVTSEMLLQLTKRISFHYVVTMQCMTTHGWNFFWNDDPWLDMEHKTLAFESCSISVSTYPTAKQIEGTTLFGVACFTRQGHSALGEWRVEVETHLNELISTRHCESFSTNVIIM